MDRFIIRKKKSESLESEAGSASSDQHQEEKDGDGQLLTKRAKIESSVSDQTKPQVESSVSDQTKPQVESSVSDQTKRQVHHMPKKRKIDGENLDCDYMRLYSKKQADDLFQSCEKSLEYFTGDLARIKVYGKWHDIPRKQVAHGDTGVTYKYSGVTVPAKPWTPLLLEIRDRIHAVTGYKFNFVLINRYADGNNYMGEHRDDEKDLVATSPIASLSLGQHRDFIFRHCEARGAQAKRKIPPVKVELEHGSLLMMNYPTNIYWYHSLPVRKKAFNTRVNMTFRDIKNIK